MGLGLLYLIAKGKEDLYMVQNPNITFFKIVYKKHTNFSIESIDQYFKTTPDFGRRVSLTVSKNADLMGDIYLKVILPALPSNNHPEISHIKKCRWVKHIGLAMIKTVDLEIGGILINRLYSDWLYIWNELTLNSGKKRGYEKMIGDVDVLTNYTDGKKSYELTIPINFWFTRESGLFLPLVAIYHHDIIIDIEFNDISELYQQKPTNYITIDEEIVLFQEDEYIYQKINNSTNIIQFVYFDILTKKLYYNNIKGDIVMNNKYILEGTTSGYTLALQNSYISINDMDFFNNNTPSIINTYLMINYVYLDNLERQVFRESDHQYLIELPTKISSRIVNNNIVSYKLNLKNPQKLLIFYAKLLSNIQINDYFNYSINPVELDKQYNNIINKVKLSINSIERVEIYDFEYYYLIEQFKSKFNNQLKNIGVYSFAIHPLDYQPSGSLNFSKVDDAYLDLTLNQKISYNHPVEISGFGLEYNILRVINGLAGLAFYN